MTRPSDTELLAYQNGEPVAAAVEDWVATDPEAAAILDALPREGLAAEIARLSSLPPATARAAAVRWASSRPAAARLDPLPDPLGKYRVIGELGHGGMGIVYLAENEDLEHRVAVKVIDPKWANDPTFREKFLSEGRGPAKVKVKDNVVTVHDLGQDGDRLYLVMEHLEGATLEHWLSARPGPAPVSDLLWVAEQVLTGLTHVHDASLIHRDIKPSNLWAQHGTGRVKILDFGVLTRTGKDTMPTGTVGYMAPEQAAGSDINCRADLFAVGAVLYRMAAQHPPHPGSDLAADLVALPADLSRFVLHLLAPEPGGRPASAAAALTELRAILGQGSVIYTHQRTNNRHWTWLTVGLVASLGIVVAGWLFDRAAERRRAANRDAIIVQVRETDLALDQGADALNEAYEALGKAKGIDLEGPADPQAQVVAMEQFQAAVKKFEAARGSIERSRGKRAALLDRLTTP